MEQQCSLSRKTCDLRIINNEMRLLSLQGTVEHIRSDLIRLKIRPLPSGALGLCFPFAKCSVSHMTPEAEIHRITKGFCDLLSKDFDGYLRSLLRRIQRLKIKSEPASWSVIAELVHKFSRLQALDNAKGVELCQMALQNVSLTTDQERITSHVTADLRKLSFG